MVELIRKEVLQKIKYVDAKEICPKDIISHTYGNAHASKKRNSNTEISH